MTAKNLVKVNFYTHAIQIFVGKQKSAYHESPSENEATFPVRLKFQIQ